MVIADMRREQRTMREIARELGRSPATVSRELRNADDHGRYLPRSADRAATERIARPRARRVMVDAEQRAVVMDLLGKRWSPEQVAHELQGRFTDQPARRLCVESIYQAIYDPDAPVTRPAKRRRRRRRRRVQGLERRGRPARQSRRPGSGATSCALLRSERVYRTRSVSGNSATVQRGGGVAGGSPPGKAQGSALEKPRPVEVMAVVRPTAVVNPSEHREQEEQHPPVAREQSDCDQHHDGRHHDTGVDAPDERPSRCGWVWAESGGSQRAGKATGQVAEQPCEVTRCTSRSCQPGTLLELVDVQTARAEVLTEGVVRTLPLGGADMSNGVAATVSRCPIRLAGTPEI